MSIAMLTDNQVQFGINKMISTEKPAVHLELLPRPITQGDRMLDGGKPFWGMELHTVYGIPSVTAV